MSQDRQKTYADKSCRSSPNYKVNDLVWVKLYPLSKASQNRSSKLMPRRDGPYIVLSQRSLTTFVVASCDKPLGVYHTSALTPFLKGTETQSPVVPLKKRGRPRKQPLIPRRIAGENTIMSASTPPHRDGLWRLQPIECLLPKPICQWRSFYSNNPNEIFTNFDNRRNHASLPHPLHQSEDCHPSRPNHIRPHLTNSIWDEGTLRVPFPSDVQRLIRKSRIQERIYAPT
ncbi:transposon Tf2-9 polyprotein [Trichonephila clavipes]|nr:transposon Tf2-9 polyprotein [Trichonephila clavipes]